MYLWRNLPDGQLLAVLRWMKTRREQRAAAPVVTPAEPVGTGREPAAVPTAKGR